MTIQIRKAEINDVNWMLCELEKFSEFFGSKTSLFGNKEYAREGFLGVIKDHVVFVAWKDSERMLVSKRIGFIAGLLTNHIFNPSIKLLTELFFWVCEEYRGSRAGLLLFKKFIDYGKENADWLTFALEAKSPMREETLARRGFHLHERSYLLELNGR